MPDPFGSYLDEIDPKEFDPSLAVETNDKRKEGGNDPPPPGDDDGEAE